MYLIYLDESGNTGKDLQNRRQPIHFISGIIVHDSIIDELNKKIKLVSKPFLKENKIDSEIKKSKAKFELHCHDLFYGKGIFEGVSEKVRFEAIEKLFLIFKKGEVVFISQGIDKKALATKYKNPIHPHNLAFMYLVEKIDLFLEEKKEKGLIIMDKNEDRGQRVINDFENFKEKTTFFGYGKRNIINILDSIYYTESYNSLPVQLADVIGYFQSTLETQKIKGKFDKIEKNRKELYKKFENNVIKNSYYCSIKPK